MSSDSSNRRGVHDGLEPLRLFSARHAISHEQVLHPMRNGIIQVVARPHKSNRWVVKELQTAMSSDRQSVWQEKAPTVIGRVPGLDRFAGPNARDVIEVGVPAVLEKLRQPSPIDRKRLGGFRRPVELKYVIFPVDLHSSGRSGQTVADKSFRKPILNCRAECHVVRLLRIVWI